MSDAQPRIYDTRPLKRGELLQYEQDMLDQLQARIQVVLDDVADRGTPAGREEDEEAWVVIETRRTPRAVLVDGVRGSGKTSLMLTFLHAVGLAHAKGTASTSARGGESDGWWTGNPEALRRCRVLPIADLHPMPEGMPIYAWLMEGFTGAAALADRARARKARHTARTRDEHEEEGLKQRLCQLQQSAVVAWNGGSGPKGTSQDEWLLNEKNHITEWAALEQRWQGWLDALLTGLEQSGALPTGGILILPIDDLDLYPKAGQHLLLALRRLYHPRLLFLLTGHHEHLVNSVTEEYLHIRHKRRNLEDPDQQEARTLATALVDKVLPSSMRLQVPLLSLNALLTHWHEWRSILDTIKVQHLPVLADDESPISTLTDVLNLYVSEVPDAASQTLFLFRPLSQWLNRLQDRPKMQRIEDQAPIIDDVIEALHSSLARPHHVASPPQIVSLKNGRTLYRSHLQGWDSYSITHYIPAHLVVAIDQQSPNGRAVTILDLLQQDVSHFGSSTGKAIKDVMFRDNSALATPRAHLRVGNLPPIDISAWPSPEVHTPLLRVWLHRTTKRIQDIVAGAPGEWNTFAGRYMDMLCHLYKHRYGADDRRSPLRPVSREDSEMGGLAEAPQNSLPRYVLNLYGAEMCTPEAGLHPTTANFLLRTLRFSSSPQDQSLEQAEARRIKRAQESISASDLTSGIDVNQSPIETLQALRRAEPLHPWHVIHLRATYKNAWWLSLALPVRSGPDQPLYLSLLSRSYVRTTIPPSKGFTTSLVSLFGLQTGNDLPPTPHTVTNAIGTLTDEWGEPANDKLLHMVRQMSSAATKEGSAIVLKNFFDWVAGVGETREGLIPTRDAKVVLQNIIPGSKLSVQADGQRLKFRLDKPPIWCRRGEPEVFEHFSGTLQVRSDVRPWMLNVEEDELVHSSLSHPDGKSKRQSLFNVWLDAVRAMVGVVQSYQADQTGTQYGTIRSDTMLATSGGIELPFPPFLAWIDHEILTTVMNSAILVARFPVEGGLAGMENRDALSRWLILMYVRVSCRLLGGYREGLLPPGTLPPSVPYPVSNDGVVAQVERELHAVYDASLGPIRKWAKDLDIIVRTCLDEDARSAWTWSSSEVNKARKESALRAGSPQSRRTPKARQPPQGGPDTP